MDANGPQIGDVVAEKFRIDGKLGGGGMGTVYGATHLMTGRRFALKWMNAAVGDEAGARERFIREFQTAGSIMHANVAAVLDVGTQDGSLFIIMEYLDGESLAQRIGRGPLAPGECVPIVLEAMRGVAAAHDSDIVHRDLKPDNIFICHSPGRPRQDIKVLDFGIVKAVNARAQVLPTITQRGIALGTPPYMAPEQVLASPSIDHRVDIYAFGVILYEALSGHLPFAAPNGMRLLEKIVEGSPTPLRRVATGVPAELEAVVMRALARDPNRRFGSIEEFADRLMPWAAGARRITPGKALRRSQIEAARVEAPRTTPKRVLPTPPPAAGWSAATAKLPQLQPRLPRRRTLGLEGWLGLLALVSLAASLIWTNLDDDELSESALPALAPLAQPPEPPHAIVPPEPIVAAPIEPLPAAEPIALGTLDASAASETTNVATELPTGVAPPPSPPAAPRQTLPPRAAVVQPAAPAAGLPHRTKPTKHKTSGVALSDF